MGETDSGEEAIEIARKKRPKIILMDVNMSPVNGFDATQQIHKLSPDSRVIAVSMHTMPAYAKRMLQFGAMGYVTKNSSKDEMMKAIMEVSNGKKYICEEVKTILAQQELDEEARKCRYEYFVAPGVRYCKIDQRRTFFERDCIAT